MNILILHGWGQNKTYWNNLANQLSEIAPTKAIDLPGFGEEKNISEQAGIKEYSDWVINYVSKNRLRDVVLIGHSFGGRISSNIASSNPKWLKSLILIGSPSIYRPSSYIKIKILFYKLFKYILPRSLRSSFYSKDMKNSESIGLNKVFRKVVTNDQTESLKHIKKPTLLIWGKSDSDVPIRIAREMNQLIPNSKLIVIDDSGHQVHIDSPSLLYGKIKTFIQSS